ncbi:hypothetical protein [Lactiplantibacillus plantarum]|nr:hypothetical protein [Lactiplantibacillus plantarum]
MIIVLLILATFVFAGTMIFHRQAVTVSLPLSLVASLLPLASSPSS